MRRWRLLYSAISGLTDFLGLEKYVDRIADVGYAPIEQPTIQVFKFRKKDKKQQ